MKKILIFTLSILALSISLFSCKPSVEGEQEAWERNKKQVSELVQQYPNFAPAIEIQFAKATEAMAAAITISDVEQKAEAMDAANDLISSSFVGKLASLESRMERIGDQQAKLGSMRMKQSVVKRAENALEASHRAMRTTEKALRSGSSTIEGAEALISEANSDLISANGKLSGAIRAAKKSMKPKKQKAQKTSN